jgi:hypothetical protein
MRSLWPVVLIISVSSAAVAAERRVGKVAATAPTAKNNATTAVAFSIAGNAKLSIQCDAPAYVAVTNDSSYVATADDVKVAADSLFPTTTPSSVSGYVSILPVTGTATCKVFVRSGNEV